MNLFHTTRRLTHQKEDHLTEFIAALLMTSDSFRSGYEALVLKRWFKERGKAGGRIIDVDTQYALQGRGGVVDMLLHLSSGLKVICEHKLDALESSADELGERDQLWKYLQAPDADGVVYFRSDWKAVQARVKDDDKGKYIHPAEGEHFLWRDLYGLLEKDQTPLGKWIREGFETMGFTPPHPSIGEMTGPDSAENRKNRHNFAKLWSATRSAARDLGWAKIERGSIAELYLSTNPQATCSQVFLSPIKSTRFLLRVTPNKGQDAIVKDALTAATRDLPGNVEVDERTVTRKEGGKTTKANVLDITTTLPKILGEEAASVDVLERRLAGFVVPILSALQK